MTLPSGGSALPTTSGSKTMSLDQFAKLAKVVYDRSGIHFQPAKKYVLESRLGRRLEELELDNFDQYLTYLTTGPYREDEFQEMFNRITINETSFFRNEPQLQVFETVTLPELLDARKASKRLRIWSAACTTGWSWASTPSPCASRPTDVSRSPCPTPASPRST